MKVFLVQIYFLSITYLFCLSFKMYICKDLLDIILYSNLFSYYDRDVMCCFLNTDGEIEQAGTTRCKDWTCCSICFWQWFGLKTSYKNLRLTCLLSCYIISLFHEIFISQLVLIEQLNSEVSVLYLIQLAFIQ